MLSAREQEMLGEIEDGLRSEARRLRVTITYGNMLLPVARLAREKAFVAAILLVALLLGLAFGYA